METFFSLRQKQKLISLPGSLTFLQLHLVPESQNKNISVSISWIKQTHKIKYNVKCTQTREYCIFNTFTKGNVTYWLFGDIPYYYLWVPQRVYEHNENDSRRTTSWNKANELCESVGAYLPYFNDRNQLTDFLQFLRQVNHIPPLKAIYIGLYYDKKQQVCSVLYY